MGRNLKPKQITDKTIKPKAVWGKIVYNKKQIKKQINNNLEIELVHIDGNQVFEMWPWLLDEVD